MNKEIKLHTIATFQDKEYELEELLNELLKENFKLQQRIDKALKELDTYRINFDFPSFADVTIEKTRKILKGGNDE